MIEKADVGFFAGKSNTFVKFARFSLSCVLATSLFSLVPAKAQDDNHAGLAVELSNPISSLTSVPIQFNWDTGIGPKDADRVTVNVQPVAPFSLNEDWNLISRTIVPKQNGWTYGALANHLWGVNDPDDREKEL